MGGKADHDVGHVGHTSVDDYWRELVTAALLGTDRRDPPQPPDGLVSDLVRDSVRPDGASRMLASVGAVASLRRAAFVADHAVAPLQPPPGDDRPWCDPVAASTWRTVISEWPVLEDEWVLTVIEQGLRLPPDVLTELLVRHRRDATRRARVAIAGGPSTAWLVAHAPELEPTTSATATAEAVVSLPDLPVPPDLAELLTADAHTFVQRLIPRFDDRSFGAAHKAVLVNLLARCRPAVLLDAATALDSTRVGFALALADLARLRHRLLVELGVAV